MRNNLLTSLLARAALAVCLALGSASAFAQSYPQKPVRMLVGYSAGGGADALARLTAAKLSDALGQQVVVENRPGAGGTLAADALARATPDGYTLYFADTAILIAPSVYAKVSYDPVKSFSPVGGVCTLPLAIVANPAFPAKTVSELVAVLKADPGKYSYGSPGVGTVQHLAMELFKKRAGVELLQVPYKGAAPIVPDLISGQIPLAIISATPAMAQARAGKAIVIALTSPVKIAGAPDWPALADTFPGFDASPKLFLLAPMDTPASVITKLSETLKAALATADLQQALAKQGATSAYASPAALAAEIGEETQRWAELAKSLNIRLD
ncbi:MAG: tripartite tricarboxylate transporter substrate binding protein [Betaproteobacteria bacterium]|nr:tripartite tricarboxylate transporter substrate binding protein [Betaproteobacteria bacterium]